ncbi:MAG: amino acid adenylation domain-containing protein, partial [Acidobacteriia bacterium]|nr:amino acid adenylation domain-containing protein [Terriglobia bacterium]
MDAAIEFLNTLASKGIKLSAEAGRLECYAQKGMLTSDIQDGIVKHRSDIIALFESRKRQQQARTHMGKAKEFPLSAGQKGLYILHKLYPGLSAYNVPLCLKINREVNKEALTKAWECLLEQFPILTARVIEKEGSFYHLLDDGCKTTIHQHAIDFADDQQLLLFVQKRAKEPFDLNRGPLARAELFTQDRQKSVLLLTIHHIVFDGTSAMILLRTLVEFYQQLCAGKPVRLSHGLPGYQEFVAWEESMLASAEGAAHACYWQQQLDGDLPTIELLPDLPRPASASFEGKRLVEDLPEDLCHWVQDFSKTHSMPPSVVFLAVFQLLLRRYTSQDDIIVGMPVMGRSEQKFLAEVGYFINMVPVRTRCEEGIKLSELLRRIQGTMLDALYHSSYPFPLMLEKLKLRHAEKNPVFQVAYAFQNFIKPEEFSTLLQQQGLSMEVMPGISQEGDFDLGLEIFEQETSFSVHLKYNSQLYLPDTAQRFIGNYCTLLRAISESPDLLLHEYPIITEQEKHQLIVAYNDTGAEYAKDKCIHELFAERVGINPGKTALVCGKQELSYQELYDKSRDLALYLRSLGVKPESVVGLCLERSLDMMVGLLGILQAEGAYLPLDPEFSEERLAYMLEDSQAAVILTQERLQSKLSALAKKDAHVIALDRQWPEISDTVAALKAKNVQLQQQVKPHHLAYVIYTSGSTGRPKGVMVEHKSLVNYLTYCINNYASPEDNVYASFLHFPLTFDASITSLFTPLLIGKAIDVNPKDNLDTFNDGEFLNQGYDFIKLTPAHLLLLRSNSSNIPEEYFQKKNLFVVGGEALTHDHVDFLNLPNVDIEIVNEYGPTEATVGCATSRFSIGKSRQETSKSCESITIGTPIANTQIYILDQHNNVQPIGVPGELHIAGDGLARGYLNRPELTGEKFVANPFAPGTRMYKTGDLARWLEDGNIQYLGRIDTQVKIRGFRIELGEIEACLNQHPGIEDSVVIAQGEEGDKQLIAFYRAKDSRAEQIVELGQEELRGHLLRSLPEYMAPAGF